MKEFLKLVITAFMLFGDGFYFVHSFQNQVISIKGKTPGVACFDRRAKVIVNRNTRQQYYGLYAGFLDGIGNFMKRFTTKATASHILVKGGAEAENKLEDLKVEIGDSPVKFAEAATKYSECPSGRSGGNLGEFGPGAMVKEFDEVVFNNELGVVHGPIKTQFGYHLIYINDRTE
eukprot:CAMPEP_0194238450 /NCGR_PEP_ID=MMETSP0158-20130606/5196_1 /TAXON_ID=33649 /ORGANISM="Thalassionema nitzschioides, Strain L26-B" /LENGTH=174 /DNA_ID=CAMNT_0038972709 /DNA_START=19 /DNA_END=543 /DNA_ORIENTATION=-